MSMAREERICGGGGGFGITYISSSRCWDHHHHGWRAWICHFIEKRGSRSWGFRFEVLNSEPELVLHSRETSRPWNEYLTHHSADDCWLDRVFGVEGGISELSGIPSRVYLDSQGCS